MFVNRVNTAKASQGICPNLPSIVIKNYCQNCLGINQVLFQLTSFSFLRESKTETQEKAGAESDGKERCCSLACSPQLTQPITHFTTIFPIIVVQGLSRQSLIKKIPYILTYGPI